MSNYDKLQLRYSGFSEHSLVSHSHLRSLTLRDLTILPSVSGDGLLCRAI